MLRLLDYLRDRAPVIYDPAAADEVQTRVLRDGKTWTEGDTQVRVRFDRYDDALLASSWAERNIVWRQAGREGVKLYIGMTPVSLGRLRSLARRCVLGAVLIGGWWVVATNAAWSSLTY